MAKAEKYVYSFGPSVTDGDASMKALLGGKGANLAEMTKIGLPVPAGFTIGTNVCTYYYDHEQAYPPELRKLVDEAMAKRREGDGRQVRLDHEPAVGLLPLGCPREHARHDGHGAQHRPQRPDGRSPGQAVGQRALRLGQLPPLRADVRRRRARHEAQDEGQTTIRSRILLEAKKHKAGVKLDTELSSAAAQGAGRASSSRPSRSAPARTFPTSRWNRCGAPSAPCSAVG